MGEEEGEVFGQEGEEGSSRYVMGLGGVPMGCFLCYAMSNIHPGSVWYVVMFSSGEYKGLTISGLWYIIDRCVMHSTSECTINALLDNAQKQTETITSRFRYLTVKHASDDNRRSEELVARLLAWAMVPFNGETEYKSTQIDDRPEHYYWLSSDDEYFNRWLLNVGKYYSWSMVARALEATSPDVPNTKRFRLMALMTPGIRPVRDPTPEEMMIYKSAKKYLNTEFSIFYATAFDGRLNRDCASIIFHLWLSYDAIGEALERNPKRCHWY